MPTSEWTTGFKQNREAGSMESDLTSHDQN